MVRERQNKKTMLFTQEKSNHLRERIEWRRKKRNGRRVEISDDFNDFVKLPCFWKFSWSAR